MTAAMSTSTTRARTVVLAIVTSLLACLLVLPARANAQITDPRVVEFQPSADHDRTENGRSMVDRYTLEFLIAGAVGVLQSINLGKPAPEQDGVIRVNFSSLLGTWPTAGVTYEARVVASGPGGAT